MKLSQGEYVQITCHNTVACSCHIGRIFPSIAPCAKLDILPPTLKKMHFVIELNISYFEKQLKNKKRFFNIKSAQDVFLKGPMLVNMRYKKPDMADSV